MQFYYLLDMYFCGTIFNLKNLQGVYMQGFVLA
jgi:hypothetical protein